MFSAALAPSSPALGPWHMVLQDLEFPLTSPTYNFLRKPVASFYPLCMFWKHHLFLLVSVCNGIYVGVCAWKRLCVPSTCLYIFPYHVLSIYFVNVIYLFLRFVCLFYIWERYGTFLLYHLQRFVNKPLWFCLWDNDNHSRDLISNLVFWFWLLFKGISWSGYIAEW